jgi:hypothetical protein
LRNAARFHLNKIRHGFLELLASHTVTATGEAVDGGLLKEVRAAGREGSGRLQYCVMRDASGLRKGFQFPWMHVENLLDCADDRARLLTLRRLLARLPSGVCFNFVLGKNLAHPEVVAEAFRRAGFLVAKVDTFFYTPPAEAGEVIETLTGKSIKGTLRRARRDLEVVDVPPRDFVIFHDQNIETVGKRSYRDFDIDRVLFELGLSTRHVRILGARRKATAQMPGPFALDAAIVCTWNHDQDLYKLVRLTNRSRDNSDPVHPPHSDASKLLILAAMEEAAVLGLTFDTDGTTTGMSKIYALFGSGVFQPAIRIQCMRETIWSLIRRDHPTLARKVGRLLGAMGKEKPCGG